MGGTGCMGGDSVIGAIKTLLQIGRVLISLVNPPVQTTVMEPTLAAPDPVWTTFEATAYIALCDTGCTGITYNGHDVRESPYLDGRRVIAVDPKVVPVGSIVEIRLQSGYTFEAIADDTGGDIKGHRIDILMPGIDRAWDFGRQDVEMRVIE